MSRTPLVALRYALIVVLLAIIGAPFVWMLLSSFQPTAILIKPNALFSPAAFTLANYARLPEAASFLLLLRNSLIIALASTAITIPLALLAAYSVYRTRYRGRSTVYHLMLVVYVFPSILLLAPLFKIFASVGLLNSWLSLIIMNVTFSAPFSVWLMRGFFTAIPAGVEEAAAIDGATELQILRRVIVPLTAPGLIVTATYTLVFSWTEFLFASVFIIDDSLKTLPVGLESLVVQYSIDWGLLAAAAVATVRRRCATRGETSSSVTVTSCSAYSMSARGRTNKTATTACRYGSRVGSTRLGSTPSWSSTWCPAAAAGSAWKPRRACASSVAAESSPTPKKPCYRRSR